MNAALLFGAFVVALGGCVLRAAPEEEWENAVDPERELEIVDDATLARLSHNGDDAPLSFRYVTETLAGGASDASVWLDRFLRALGPDVENDVVRAWPDATAYESGVDRRLELSPWRLVAVANRMDLAGKPRLGARGEGRLVFALTEGAADDAASVTRGATLIFEFALPEDRSQKEWGEAWHALGEPLMGSARYDAALVTLVSTFAQRSALAQIRYNDSVLGFRQWDVGEDGAIAVAPLRNTPRRTLDRSSALVAFAEKHAGEILRDEHLVPPSLLATSAPRDGHRWTLPGQGDEVRDAFTVGTCDGCHARNALDGGFHVSPHRSGSEKLSPMLKADLRRRAELLWKAVHPPPP